MTREPQPEDLSRRQMLGLLAGGVVGVGTGGVVAFRLSRAGGSTEIPGAAFSGPTTTTTEDDPADATTTTTEPEASEPRTEPYQPVRDEVFVEAKLAGVRVVEALMTYQAATGLEAPLAAAVELSRGTLSRPDLAEAAEVLVLPDTDSVARVVYPQLGGLHPHTDPTSASIMVVVDQHLLHDGVETVVSRCVDVRVVLDGLEWRLERVADTSGPPVPQPSELSAEAERVLGHSRIDMPDAVRWDIYEGIIDTRILNEMADLADRTPIAVTTCMRGHPVHVFGTSGLSAHSVGRAVDIWAVGDQPVVQQRDNTDSVAHSVCQDLYDSGRIHRLGAPWAFDGVGGRSWTDPVHQDHLHLGVSA